jgi:hypothetical protein
MSMTRAEWIRARRLREMTERAGAPSQERGVVHMSGWLPIFGVSIMAVGGSRCAVGILSVG